MSIEHLKQVIGRAIVDSSFREGLFANPDTVLADYSLTQTEKAAIENINQSAFEQLVQTIKERIAGSGGHLKPDSDVFGSSEPAIMLDANEPAIMLDASEPAIMLDASEPAIMLDANEPAIMLDASEPAIMLDASEPAIMLDANEPAIMLDASEPAIMLDASEPAIMLDEAGRAARSTVATEQPVGVSQRPFGRLLKRPAVAGVAAVLLLALSCGLFAMFRSAQDDTDVDSQEEPVVEEESPALDSEPPDEDGEGQGDESNEPAEEPDTEITVTVETESEEDTAPAEAICGDSLLAETEECEADTDCAQGFFCGAADTSTACTCVELVPPAGDAATGVTCEDFPVYDCVKSEFGYTWYTGRRCYDADGNVTFDGQIDGPFSSAEWQPFCPGAGGGGGDEGGGGGGGYCGDGICQGSESGCGVCSADCGPC